MAKDQRQISLAEVSGFSPTDIAPDPLLADSSDFVDTEWDGSKSRWDTPEALAASVPDAIAAWARAKAKSEKTELSKQYLKLPFKEPGGKININAVRNALARATQLKGVPGDVKAAAKAQLEKLLEKYNAEQEKKQAELSEEDRTAANELAGNLVGLKDIPILRVGPTKNDYEIDQQIYSDVLDSYDADSIHMAPIVDVPHETEQGPALGYIAELYEKAVDYPNGETINWIYGKPQAASPQAAQRLKELQDGPMMFNSPELVPEAELYDAERTADWPEGADSKYYLRRVNFLGAQPPAQFGQAAALLSDQAHRIYNPLIQLSEGKPTMKNLKLSEADVVAAAAKEAAKAAAVAGEKEATLAAPPPPEAKGEDGKKIECPECGAEIEMGDKFCADCGHSMAEAKMGEVPEAAKGKETPEEEKAEAKEEKAMADKKTEERLALAEAKVKGYEKRLADLEAKHAREVDAQVRARVTTDFEKYLGDGKILPNEASDVFAVMLDAARNDRVVKLADGKDAKTYDVLLKHFEQSERLLTPGRLQVIKQADAVKVVDGQAVYRKHLSELVTKNPQGGQKNVEEAIRLAEAETGQKIRVIGG